MSEEKKYGRGSVPVEPAKPTDPVLSEADKARIIAEEKFRAQIRGSSNQIKRKQSFVIPALLGVTALSFLGYYLLKPAPPAPAPTQIATPPPENPPVVKTKPAGLEDLQVNFVRDSCETSIKSQLKSPTSAQFNDNNQPVFNNNKWSWDSHVDAQNSFGAMMRTKTRCRITGNTPEDAKITSELADGDGIFASDVQASEKKIVDSEEKQANEYLNSCAKGVKAKIATTPKSHWININKCTPNFVASSKTNSLLDAEDALVTINPTTGKFTIMVIAVGGHNWMWSDEKVINLN